MCNVVLCRGQGTYFTSKRWRRNRWWWKYTESSPLHGTHCVTTVIVVTGIFTHFFFSFSILEIFSSTLHIHMLHFMQLNGKVFPYLLHTIVLAWFVALTIASANVNQIRIFVGGIIIIKGKGSGQHEMGRWESRKLKNVIPYFTHREYIYLYCTTTCRVNYLHLLTTLMTVVKNGIRKKWKKEIFRCLISCLDSRDNVVRLFHSCHSTSGGDGDDGDLSV